ncbi:MAG: hypothetical protein V1735_01700 [Nanoarchaeota archaeon]
MKKGQAAGAATLIAIIALFTILYILFLPADEREKLLGEPTLDGTGTSSHSKKGNWTENRTLVRESPGRMDSLSFKEYEHDLPSVNLYTRSSAERLKSVNALYAKNGVFDRKDAVLTFRVADPGAMQDVLLSFVVKTHQGALTITLNGQEVFASSIERANIEPIALDSGLLQEENELVFSVSAVGWAFWRTNEYELSNIMITSDVLDTSNQESRNTFMVTDTEKNNLDKAKIRFVPECEGSVGTLSVLLNNENIYEATPDCGSPVLQEFSTSYLDAGENKVVFKAESGRIIVDQIQVVTELKEIAYPTYFFDLSEDEFSSVEDDNMTVNMTFRFIEDETLKKADIYVNGHKTQLYTHGLAWSRNIDTFLEEGSNGVKIEPDGSLDVTELKVILYEKD